MNWRHFQAFLWLRYRLLFNRIRRGGIVSAVILGIFAVSALFLSAGMFVGSLLLGLWVMPQASPLVHLLVWDGLVGFFLFIWLIVLLSELQRSEPLSLEKFLHLPVSLTGAFLINYLSSLVNLRLIVFVPAMLGLILGLTFSRGPLLLLCLPLLAAFLFMVTALTHQFQGWLASLMSNPRRRRSVVVFVTLAVVAVTQVPNVVVQVAARKGTKSQRNSIEALQQKINESEAIRLESEAQQRKVDELQRATGHISAEEYKRRVEENSREIAATSEKLKRIRERDQAEAEQKKQEEQQTLQQLGQTARVLNWFLPPFWLPVGVAAAAEGDVLPALLATLGLGLIGTVSFWRSYATTRRLYTGQVNSGRKRAVKAEAPAAPGRPRELLLERKIPWLSEQVAAVALAGFRSLARAPEAKMILLSPVIMVAVFGSVLFANSGTVPGGLRPLMAFGAMLMVLLGMIGFLGNQFGFDRDGFRVFVLCGARRRDILLGKNLAFVPYTAALGAVVLSALQCIYPMPADQFLAVLLQAVSMYLLFCMLANWLSILVPICMPAGAMRPSNVKAIPILCHAAFVFLFPAVLSLTLLPLVTEYALDALGIVRGVPVCLLLATAECAVVVILYSFVLTWQGHVLQAREQRILEVVTAKAE